jgi:hypothetical protein
VRAIHRDPPPLWLQLPLVACESPVSIRGRNLWGGYLGTRLAVTTAQSGVAVNSQGTDLWHVLDELEVASIGRARSGMLGTAAPASRGQPRPSRRRRGAALTRAH